MSDYDPYAGNILVTGLGPIRSPDDFRNQLTWIPKRPRNIASIPKHVRLHMLMQLRDLHLARLEEIRLGQSLDLTLRQGYRYRDPDDTATWAMVSNEPLQHKTPRMPPSGVLAIGHSGTGKTEAILRLLHAYPSQVITHASFPKLLGSHQQLVYLSVDVPGSGKSSDLAEALMVRYDEAMTLAVPDYCSRFEQALGRQRRDGARMLEEWRQVVTTNFLGILHLDEIQNLFKLATLKARARKQRGDERPELSIVEDMVLKWILTLMNTWGIPLVVSGTPDGVQALLKRMATAQRFAGGTHSMRHFQSASDPEFRGMFFPQLLAFQLVAKPLRETDELAELLIDLTAGIPRLLIVLWVTAHRVAYEHNEDALTVNDIKHAAEKYLAPVASAVAALKSGNPLLMSRYEDLLPRDWDVWKQLAGSQ